MRTWDHNNDSEDKVDDKRPCAVLLPPRRISTHTCTYVLPFPAARNTEEASVLFCALKTLGVWYKSESSAPGLTYKVCRIKGVPDFCPESPFHFKTLRKAHMNYRAAHNLLIRLSLFLKENSYLRLWVPCSSQGT